MSHISQTRLMNFFGDTIKSFRQNRKKSLAIGLLVVLILAFIVALVLNLPKDTSAWFNDSWGYRVRVQINNSGATVNNQKVKLDIDTQTLISAGKMQVDCGDSRFTDNNGKLLPYYIDTAGGACDTVSTDYYILLPVINSGATVIYHYYGNPSIENGTVAVQFAESTFTPQSTSNASEQLSRTPVGFWRFDEGTGTTAFDSTKRKNNGTLSGSALPGWQNKDNCIADKCLLFIGDAGYVTITTQKPLEITGAITVSAWIRPTILDRESSIVAKRGSSGQYGYRLYIDSNNKVNFEISSNGTSLTIATSNTSVKVGNWFHLVGVYVPSSSIKVYINGRQDGINTTAIPASIHNSTANLNIATENGGSTNWYSGFIDDVKIFNFEKPLSAIQGEYAVGLSRGSTTDDQRVQLGVGSATDTVLTQGLIGSWSADIRPGTQTNKAFRVDTTAPSIPGTPSSASPSSDTTPTWTWTASTDSGSGLATTAYSVEWCQDSGFSGCGSNVSTSITNSFTHTTPLASGTWYFRVTATDRVSNTSAYSPNGSFIVD